MRGGIFFGLIAAFLSGCAVTQPPDLTAFKEVRPRSILVVPPANKSLDVDAPNYLLTTLPYPIAEKGYYVFPVHTVKTVLEQEGLYEGEQVRQHPTQALADLFGADAVLYVTINKWDAQYALLSTVVTVDFDYEIVNRDGGSLWKANQKMQYSPQQAQGGHPIAMLISAAVSAAVTRAAPNYMPLTKQANNIVLRTGVTAIPDGPYMPQDKAKK